VISDLTESIFGKPDPDSTLPATIARRMSDSVLSTKWWLDTLSIDDGSGDPGNTDSSWDMQVYFDPSKSKNLKLGDFLEEEEDPMTKREKARQLYKKRAYSDDLYRGRGTVPAGNGGVRVKATNIFDDEHPIEPRFAPEDVLEELPTIEEQKRRAIKEARRQKRAAQSSYATGSSYTSDRSSYDSRPSYSTEGSSFTEDSSFFSDTSSLDQPIERPRANASTAKSKADSMATGNAKLKALFDKYDKGTGMIKVGDLDSVAQVLSINASQLSRLKAAVETDGSDDVDFATFEAMLLPFSDAAY